MTGTNLHKGAMLKQAFGIASPQDYRDVYETLNDIRAEYQYWTPFRHG